MQHSAFSYLMLPFTFFFFLMNSSLHQWAAEISTKQSKTPLTAVEGSMYVYCVCVFVCVNVYVCIYYIKYENMCSRLHMLSLWPQNRASLCSLVNSCFTPEAKQLWISPKATNDLCVTVSECVCVCVCVCACVHIITVYFVEKKVTCCCPR